MTNPWDELLRGSRPSMTRSGASVKDVAEVEQVLKISFPSDLRDLYLASDGVFDRDGQWFIIWPLSDVVTNNQQAWELEGEERRKLVGFGDDGTGDPFCVPSSGKGGVFHWSPVDGAATRLVDTVTQFWIEWTAGMIKT